MWWCQPLVRAVLEIPLLLIHSFINWWFVEIPSVYIHFKPIKARELKFWDVTCRVSQLTKKLWLSGWASWWRVCYQRSLPFFLMYKKMRLFEGNISLVIQFLARNNFPKQKLIKSMDKQVSTNPPKKSWSWGEKWSVQTITTQQNPPKIKN